MKKKYYASFIEDAYEKQKEFEDKFARLCHNKIRSGYGNSEEEKNYLYNLSEIEIEKIRYNYDCQMDDATLEYKNKFGDNDLSDIEIKHYIMEINLDDKFDDKIINELIAKRI